MITINKGLDLPIAGTPSQVINDGKSITKVALLGEEYVGMRPTMHARVGDEVKSLYRQHRRQCNALSSHQNLRL